MEEGVRERCYQSVHTSTYSVLILEGSDQLNKAGMVECSKNGDLPSHVPHLVGIIECELLVDFECDECAGVLLNCQLHCRVGP